MLLRRAVFEPFRNPVSIHEIDNRLSKLNALKEASRREAKREQRRWLASDRPHLWILSPTLSPNTLQSFSATPRQGWEKGVYFLPSGQPARLVAIHQLPVTPKTLWLRLMGRGSVQEGAIAELLALPDHHPFKFQTIEHLAILQIQLQMGQNLGTDERGLIMSLNSVYEEWRKVTLQEGELIGEQRGRQEGELVGQQRLVLQLLNRKVGDVPDALRQAIMGLPLTELEALGEDLLNFSNLSDLIHWLESHGLT
ncbi:MAG: DUF4351 domain-containing protein [Oculatellaceae cyanobacterium Prado106]|jgi:hypothetical protein|nr:DUF4351 domain-containing protein [Oculatellaceae cyanobacterium Prado106]